MHRHGGSPSVPLPITIMLTPADPRGCPPRAQRPDSLTSPPARGSVEWEAGHNDVTTSFPAGEQRGAPIPLLGRKPRILVVAGSFPAPSETFVLDHVIGLHRRGWEVMVACARVGRNGVLPCVVRAMSDDAATVSRARVVARLFRHRGMAAIFSPATRHAARKAGPLLEIAKGFEPDIIHAHFGPNGMLASFAARALRVPLLVTFHGYDVTVLPRVQGWGPYRVLLRDARAVVHSPHVARLLRSHLPVPLHHVTLGVDASLFRGALRSSAWRPHVRLLTVGRLIFQKGHHVAIEALALLRHRQPGRDWSLTVCGDGPDHGLLEDRARQLGLDDAVTFTGSRSYTQVAADMRAADILLVPSVRGANGSQEAFCRVALEGLASGLAVVASDTGGLAETVADAGILVRAGSAAAFAEAVETLVRRATPEGMCRAAWKRAERFSIERMWNEHDDVARHALCG